MPRLQQAAQVSMLELSNVIQANNEERKRQEAETDKLYQEYKNIYYKVNRQTLCECSDCDKQ